MTHEVQRPATVVAHVASPRDLDAALAWLARPGAKPVAGGTDLLIELDRGDHGDVTTLVDLSRIAGLDGIAETDGVVRIGPLVTHNQCASSELLGRVARPLVQASWEVGSPQLRNRATIAGNVVTASPANDTLSALVALDAELTLTSARGERTIALADFHLGVRRTALEPDELVTAISFGALGPSHRSIFLKLGLRRAQAISVVHLAAVVRLDPAGERVEDARLALGSVAPTIVRAAAAEDILVGSRLDAPTIEAAAQAAADSVRPIDDLRAPASYRTDQVAEMVARALRALGDDGGVLPSSPPLLGGTPAPGDSGDPVAEHGEASTITSTVNGDPLTAPGVGLTLLDWLRSAGLTGVKEGCAEGECGSCTVDLDGGAVLSCLVPATRAEGAAVTTIEGLASDGPLGERLHPLQQAFIDTGAVQCGFCIPGFLMAGAKLLAEHPEPTDEQIRIGLSGNLCRCTGYYKITDAVRVALGGDLETTGDR